MKTMFCELRRSKALPRAGVFGFVFTILMAVAGIFPASTAQSAGQKTFPSASAAAKALVAAAQTNDTSALLNILGPGAKEIVSSGDAVEDRDNRQDFVEKYQQMHRLVIEPDGTTTLYVGAENWPTPIPLVNKGGEWYFDTPAGKQEILYRRIGRNELAVIQVCHELVDAEKEYYATPHDGVQQYAQKLYSDPGKHNGLYWQASAGEGESPIGPFVASASAEGYSHSPCQKSEPFQGYYFRVLAGEGTSEGDAHNYIVDGKMTKGFAVLAFPAEYRSSGVMTFMVNQDDIVYEKDLGAHTTQTAPTLTRYQLDSTWRKAD
jgi:hypothetical protein